jgi:hypothetical protein
MNLLKMSSSDLIQFLKANDVSWEICNLLAGKLMINNQLIFECFTTDLVLKWPTLIIDLVYLQRMKLMVRPYIALRYYECKYGG